MCITLSIPHPADTSTHTQRGLMDAAFLNECMRWTYSRKMCASCSTGESTSPLHTTPHKTTLHARYRLLAPNTTSSQGGELLNHARAKWTACNQHPCIELVSLGALVRSDIFCLQRYSEYIHHLFCICMHLASLHHFHTPLSPPPTTTL